MRTCRAVPCVRACACVRARIKNTLRFLDPPTSVLVKYLVIRRKVRPLVYSTYNAGRHISPTCPPVLSSLLSSLSLSPLLPSLLLPSFADIAPLIEYTYANSPADVAIVIYFSLVAAILILTSLERILLILLERRDFSPYLRERRVLLFAKAPSSTDSRTCALRERKKVLRGKNQVEKGHSIASEKGKNFSTERSLPRTTGKLPQKKFVSSRM